MVGKLRRKALVFIKTLNEQDVKMDAGRKLKKYEDIDEFEVQPYRDPISAGDLQIGVSVDVDGFPSEEDDVPAFTEHGSLILRCDSYVDIGKARLLRDKLDTWIKSTEKGPSEHDLGLRELSDKEKEIILEEATRTRCDDCMNDARFMSNMIHDYLEKEDIQEQLEAISTDPDITIEILGFDPWGDEDE